VKNLRKRDPKLRCLYLHLSRGENEAIDSNDEDYLDAMIWPSAMAAYAVGLKNEIQERVFKTPIFRDILHVAAAGNTVRIL
jgi:hypothetical protein